MSSNGSNEMQTTVDGRVGQCFNIIIANNIVKSVRSCNNDN